MAISGAFPHAPLAGSRGLRFGLPRLSFYVLRQTLGPVMLLAFLMTSVVWLTQILPLLDLVINRGQSAFTFIYLILLLLPTLLMIILPIAFFFGSLVALQRLSSDSELVVMASAGYSRTQLAVPVLLAAAIVMGLTYLCSLYLMPAGQRALHSKMVDIQADVGAALLNEGQFSTPAKGLTVFIRQLNPDGEIRGVLVHNSRDEKHPITYIAEKGQLAQTPAGARLLMSDGTVEQSAQDGRQLSVLKFQRYVLSLDQFASQTRNSLRKASERFLGELLWPDDGPGLTPQQRRTFAVEANSRLSQPLYCIAFAFIALAAVLRGRRQRGPLAMRLTFASLATAGLRIAGYGVQGPAQSHPALMAAFYLIPLLGAAAAIAVLAGFSPAAILARRRQAIPNKSAAA